MCSGSTGVLEIVLVDVGAYQPILGGWWEEEVELVGWLGTG